MCKIIICPCCGKEIVINDDDDGSTVFLNAQNQENINEILERISVELGEIKGGE